MASPKKRFRAVVICAALFLVAFPQAVSSQIDRSRPRSDRDRVARSSRVQARESAQTASRSRPQADRMGRPEPRNVHGEAAAAVDPRSRAADEGGELEMEAIDLSTERQRRERRRAELQARRLRRQALIRQRLESDPAMLRDDEEMLDLDDVSPRPPREPRPIRPFEGLVDEDGVTPIGSKPRSYASRLRELEREDKRPPSPADLDREDRRRATEARPDREDRRRAIEARSDMDREDRRRDADESPARIAPARRRPGLSNPAPTIQRQLQDARNRTRGLEPHRRPANPRAGSAFTRRPAKRLRLPPEKLDSRGQVIDDEDPL
jgi:hypothetical protein